MTWPSHYEADWLYLLQDIRDTHHVKVGISNNPNRRVRELTENTGYNWRIIRAIQLGPRRALYAEQHLLKEYKLFRVRGTEQLRLSSKAALLRLLHDYDLLKATKPAKPIAERITPPGLTPQQRRKGRLTLAGWGAVFFGITFWLIIAIANVNAGLGVYFGFFWFIFFLIYIYSVIKA